MTNAAALNTDEVAKSTPGFRRHVDVTASSLHGMQSEWGAFAAH